MLRCSSGGSGLSWGVEPFRRQFFNTFNISRGLKQDFSLFIEWPTEQKGTYIFPISPYQCLARLLFPIGTLWEEKWEHVFDWRADSPLSLLLCLEDSQCSCTYRISAAWRLAKIWRHRHEVIASKAASVRNVQTWVHLDIFTTGKSNMSGYWVQWWTGDLFLPLTFWPHYLTLNTDYPANACLGEVFTFKGMSLVMPGENKGNYRCKQKL